MNEARAWGLMYRNGSMAGVAWRTRSAGMDWAAQRMIGAHDYTNHDTSWCWRNIKRRHGCALVRVLIIIE